MTVQSFTARAIIIGVLFVGNAGAQDRTMTLEECLELGLQQSRTLHASVMRAAYAEAKAAEASAVLYPSLRFQGGYARLSEVPEFRIAFQGNVVAFPVILDTYSSRLTLQQPLFAGGRLRGLSNQAEYVSDAARFDVSKDKADLLLSIKTAYWNLYRAIAYKRVSDDNVAVLAAHVADAENLLKQGLLTNSDILKVKVQHSNARLMQSDAQNRVQLATIALNSLIGLPLETRTITASTLSTMASNVPENDSLLSFALRGRAEIRGMEMRLRAAEAGVTVARSGWFPQISLTGNFTYARPNQRVFPARDEFRDTWDIGISLQFDLWNNLSTLHQTGAAQAQYEQVRDGLDLLKDGITLEVAQGVLTVRQARERIRLAELGVGQAAEHYRVTADKFKSGLTANSELLDAELMLVKSKLQLTDALVECELAQARLEKAAGVAQ